jgi:hypothetical protein
MQKFVPGIYLLLFVMAVSFSSVKAQQFHGGLTLGLAGSQVAGDTY